MTIGDDFFGPPYIDADEWRDVPVRHRYVHGGFEGTDTRFSFYFPQPARYAGRFLQLLGGGVGGSENMADVEFPAIALAEDCGAYLVESNQGHVGFDLGVGDRSILCWRASAETARYSKQLAAEMYGGEPHHGYLFGGSGGGNRSLACLENVQQLWDGAVPFIIPDMGQVFGVLPMVMHAHYMLEPVLAKVDDAIEVGGGDPFAGLTVQQADALATLFKAGFPRGRPLTAAIGCARVLKELFGPYDIDPSYFDDFWTVPGYLGADDPDRFRDDIVEFETTIDHVMTSADLEASVTPQSRVYPAGTSSGLLSALLAVKLTGRVVPAGIRLVHGDPRRLHSATVTLLSGRGIGRTIDATYATEDTLVALPVEALASPASVWPLQGLRSGDRVRISNRNYLAYVHRFRHQIDPVLREWQHVTVDSVPIYRQRAKDDIPFLVKYTHDLHGAKVILVQNMADTLTWANLAVRYQVGLHAKFGAALDNSFRLYFVEHAEHGPGLPAASAAVGFPDIRTKLIDYEGHVERAIRDLIDWVEFGKEPVPSSAYTLTPHNAVMLAPDANTRRGLQPVVMATANGSPRADVRSGEEVTLLATIETPPGAGHIALIEWDPEGTGTYPVRDETVTGTETTKTTTTTHAYSTPGTYFPAVQVTVHHENATPGLYRLINLGRARVVVAP